METALTSVGLQFSFLPSFFNQLWWVSNIIGGTGCHHWQRLKDVSNSLTPPALDPDIYLGIKAMLGCGHHLGTGGERLQGIDRKMWKIPTGALSWFEPCCFWRETSCILWPDTAVPQQSCDISSSFLNLVHLLLAQHIKANPAQIFIWIQYFFIPLLRINSWRVWLSSPPRLWQVARCLCNNTKSH